jgi:hypothetical protein
LSHKRKTILNGKFDYQCGALCYTLHVFTLTKTIIDMVVEIKRKIILILSCGIFEIMVEH